MPLSRYQLKIALSYLSILMIMLVLLNTYPVWVSQNIMFDSTRDAMRSRAAGLTSTLSALDSLTVESVARVMAVLDNQTQYRTVVVDSHGLAVYDNLTTGAVTGRYTLTPEMADALFGSDVFHSAYKDEAFNSRFAMPVIARGVVMGALYLVRYDTAQGELLSGLISNLFRVSTAIFAVVVLFSIFIALALTRRISVILYGIRAAYGGDYAYELPVRGRDELAEVAGRLNQLFSILHKTEGLRQQFVSDASHELKTPLAAVRLLTDSILETPDMPAETVREFVADIGAETERLSRMTEKLMLLSRLDTRQPERAAVTDPAAVLRRVARMLKPLARDAGVELRCELAKDCRVAGGEDDLYHIVFNLIDNAIKYNKPGGTVQVFTFRQGAEVHIVVADTGVGIPETELPLIFGRFYRVDKARSREAGGAGLGLSIAADMTARMGGSIAAESEVGKGSRFTVKFPLADKEGSE
ncbi:MAG: HAMP domain-containing histidine kinase [Oscillospiraceae bacterium]|jgi:signal transduction histidine kinase|nr:HAMP domain-containing histidine kinase [Oscillospiraceae bacterium]